MNLLVFGLFAIAGSGIWNGLLVGRGTALGTQYQLIDQYSGYMNYAVYLAIIVVVGWLVIRAIRRRRKAH